MNWLLSRLAAGIGLAALGAVVGLFFGVDHAALIGALLGFSLALLLVIGRDTFHGYRLIQWLRSAQEGPAPRDTGWWGELGYRIERSIRLREKAASTERERLTQFLTAIEASPNGVMLLDAHDQIEWCSSLAADHFGLDPLRDRRQRVTTLVRAPAFVGYLQAGRFDEPVQVRDSRGHRRLAVLVRAYGDGLRLVLSQDVTEQERADEMRRDFVANVSHEIRTPLTVLAGFIETMTNLSLSETERRRVLELMKQQADRMNALVSDLLTLAQLEGSPWPHADRWVVLGPLLAQVAADARQLSAGRHAIEFGAAHAQVAGAAIELQSAISNVVLNAVRYTPEGGRIDVTWKRRLDGRGELAVCDNGPGIAREHLPRLTERFYRVDGSRSRDTGGTGLGLSIVKHVMQRHGGELEVQSEVGKGSTFRLVFPAVRLREGSGEFEGASVEAASHAARVAS